MKKSLIFAGLLALPAVAQADPRDDALLAMLRCSGLGDKQQRLACYDSGVLRVQGALRAPVYAPPAYAPSGPPVAAAPVVAAPIAAAPVIMASAPPAAGVPPPVRHIKRKGFLDRIFGPDEPPRGPQRTVADFGSESIANGGTRASPRAMDGDTIDAFSARLTSYDLSGGDLVVTLDNGQVWRQVGGDPVGHMQFAAPRYVATLSRGYSGAYTLKLSNSGLSLPVRRIH